MGFKLPVFQLCKQRLSNRDIARQLELPEKTVRDWRNRYSKYLGASFLEKQR
jgi:transposase-like protein